MSLGYVLYEGPSQIDQKTPIVVLATGFDGSSNRKTGDMVQTWILVADEKPTDALKSERDLAVCGLCPHRGGAAGSGRSCYVNVGQAPASVYAAFRRGRYDAAPRDFSVFAGRKVRLGAYGDPAAAPLGIWLGVVGAASGHTGYTHQWLTCDPGFARLCMASVDSLAEQFLAESLGYRTFRVRPEDERTRGRGEALCPASAEAGGKLTCETCMACSGTLRGQRGGITISVHGSAGVRRAYGRNFKGVEVIAA